ncbi:histone-lysine N-trimethyltransferase SMYD5-like [Bactrocera dorsalis]|uniref:Histone-lysine N-trimethyltransferase SMYD5-like n=1 Tax=Bactrocera dorsalis TaxID=27457 RepID=A0ABM3JHI5_BACDO|nr:histone-lysine N-trimethyltransferase SMYD5-like [Bactrocera dorsalis]
MFSILILFVYCMRPLETAVENVHRLAYINGLVVPLPEYDQTTPWLQQFTQCANYDIQYFSKDCRMGVLKEYHRDACMGDFHTDATHPLVGEFLSTKGAGLYLLQSKINHSCVPNAHSIFPYTNDVVVLKRLASVQVGEEICIYYLSECQLERSRHSRQNVNKFVELTN